MNLRTTWDASGLVHPVANFNPEIRPLAQNPDPFFRSRQRLAVLPKRNSTLQANPLGWAPDALPKPEIGIFQSSLYVLQAAIAFELVSSGKAALRLD